MDNASKYIERMRQASARRDAEQTRRLRCQEDDRRQQELDRKIRLALAADTVPGANT
jgi:hypothetical protein